MSNVTLRYQHDDVSDRPPRLNTWQARRGPTVWINYGRLSVDLRRNQIAVIVQTRARAHIDGTLAATVPET